MDSIPCKTRRNDWDSGIRKIQRLGSGNDVEVLLADEDNFTNWRNRHPAQVLYQSGKVTVGEIDVPINTPGNYYLVFNNAFSAFAAKTVEANVELRYRLKVW
jgi:hypothetical protein